MSKRFKPLLIATSLTILALIPVLYLKKLHDQTTIEDFGHQFRLDPFAFATNDGAGVFTHVDTEQQVSLILYYDAAKCADGSCETLLKEQDAALSFLKTELTPEDPTAGKGKAIRAVAWIRGAKPTLNPAWDVVQLEPEEKLPLPGNYHSDLGAAYLVVDDDGFLRSDLKPVTADRKTKLFTILRKVASQQNLMDYLTQQTLMWEKAKKYQRGEVVEPAS